MRRELEGELSRLRAELDATRGELGAARSAMAEEGNAAERAKVSEGDVREMRRRLFWGGKRRRMPSAHILQLQYTPSSQLPSLNAWKLPTACDPLPPPPCAWAARHGLRSIPPAHLFPACPGPSPQGNMTKDFERALREQQDLFEKK